MSQSSSVASTLPPPKRKQLAIEVLSKAEPVTHMAAREQVSRKFIYQQKQKAESALEQAFAPTPEDSEVLFYLPVTETWISELILALILICHSSYRGVVELLRDVFDFPAQCRNDSQSATGGC